MAHWVGPTLVEEALGLEVLVAMVAGVGVAVAPGEIKMRRRRSVVEGRRRKPTSIIPHTSTTAGGGESGADLLS